MSPDLPGSLCANVLGHEIQWWGDPGSINLGGAEGLSFGTGMKCTCLTTHLFIYLFMHGAGDQTQPAPRACCVSTPFPNYILSPECIFSIKPECKHVNSWRKTPLRSQNTWSPSGDFRERDSLFKKDLGEKPGHSHKRIWWAWNQSMRNHLQERGLERLPTMMPAAPPTRFTLASDSWSWTSVHLTVPHTRCIFLVYSLCLC